MVRVLPLTLELIKIPPPVAAELLATVELLMVNVPPLTMPPPCKVAKFPEIVELSRVKVPPKGLIIPPPS